MDFSFNDTQKEVQNLANQILTDLSTTERLNVIDQQEDRFDEKLWAQLAESGLLGTSISEENGGMGFGFTELSLFIEEVGRTVAAAPVIPVLVSAALPIQKFGTPEQQKRLLPGVVSGEKLITAGLLEALAECPSAPATVAESAGKGFKLTGCKIAVPFAYKAERILVTAKVGDEVGVFLLDPQADGVELNREVSTTREPWYEVVLTGALVAEEDVLMTGSEGQAAALWVAERTMAASCAMQVGVADQSTKITAGYTCERVQFGVPVGSFQAVQHRAADCFIDVTCLKLTTYQAVSLLDSEKEATNEVLMAKIWAGDTGHRVSYASQHLHGGTGIDKDYHLWRYCLWARQLEMTLGSSAALLAALGGRIAEGRAFAE
ncbi:acyl-CoA dehydrogenase family protein [Endozoicomonas arenosclerae]|uniref:acyl-CoA dehydrogenase family protein n=1 Tax=Endozoicomonas arenosclerae TaxID=1633495 RepID=UPI000785B455|nr:acyl-CoA dehydrogenase family protein [Endozoicomonas arenosclerae]